jgi:hypothetical protein
MWLVQNTHTSIYIYHICISRSQSPCHAYPLLKRTLGRVNARRHFGLKGGMVHISHEALGVGTQGEEHSRGFADEVDTVGGGGALLTEEVARTGVVP